MYDLDAEPRGETYRRLLTAALPSCDRFLFVDVPSRRQGEIVSAFRERARDLVRELTPYLVNVEQSMSWPGTELSEYPGAVHASVYRYRFEPTTLGVLTRVADHLYAWRFPELPADLCLLRPDGEPWLVTMAADDDCYLTLTKEEADGVARAVPGLTLRRHYAEH